MTTAAAILAMILIGVAGANLAIGRLPRKPPMPGVLVGAGRRGLHCIENPGDGPAVVLIHGMPGLAQDWKPVTDELPAGFRSLAIDRPGYGYSPGKLLTFFDQVDVVYAVVKELNVREAVFVGHSYGAIFALEIAIRYPEIVRALVLTAPAAGGTRLAPRRLKVARIVRRLQLPVVRQIADLFFLRAVRATAARRGARSAYGA
ncbi:MAG: alpha/beta hydrolase, partial [Solirubrobacterales bacterium]